MLSPESVLEPLNASTEPWVRSIVWTDFRVAVTLLVVAPLALLGWSVVSCRPPSLGGEKITNPPRTSEVALRLMTSYWQASSLLLITVLLNVQESQLGVATGLIAQAMIVLSLWWWTDLNDEIDGAEPTALISALSCGGFSRVLPRRRASSFKFRSSRAFSHQPSWPTRAARPGSNRRNSPRRSST